MVANLTTEQNEMWEAAVHGNVDILQRVATRDNTHFHDQNGVSILHMAALKGHSDCVEFLLQMGIAPNVQNNSSQTPLHYCVAAPFTPDRARAANLLLAYDARLLEHECNNGNTPLHQATLFSDVDMIQLLLRQGANVHAKNNHNSTPLHLACHYAHVDIACKLLDHGADWLARNANGETPLDVAAVNVKHQQVSNAILAHQAGVTFRLRQEVQDLKNFVMATAVRNVMDDRIASGAGGSRSLAMTTTTPPSDQDDDK